MIFITTSSNSISLQMRSEKSHRDGTLLTVDFNLRTRDDVYSTQVPQGRHFEVSIVSSLRDFEAMLFSSFRRLKPTVNKISSLRDYS